MITRSSIPSRFFIGSGTNQKPPSRSLKIRRSGVPRITTLVDAPASSTGSRAAADPVRAIAVVRKAELMNQEGRIWGVRKEVCGRGIRPSMICTTRVARPRHEDDFRSGSFSNDANELSVQSNRSGDAGMLSSRTSLGTWSEVESVPTPGQPPGDPRIMASHQPNDPLFLLHPFIG